jgi:hypothetical protein
VKFPRWYWLTSVHVSLKYLPPLSPSLSLNDEESASP